MTKQETPFQKPSRKIFLQHTNTLHTYSSNKEQYQQRNQNQTQQRNDLYTKQPKGYPKNYKNHQIQDFKKTNQSSKISANVYNLMSDHKQKGPHLNISNHPISSHQPTKFSKSLLGSS